MFSGRDNQHSSLVAQGRELRHIRKSIVTLRTSTQNGRHTEELEADLNASVQYLIYSLMYSLICVFVHFIIQEAHGHWDYILSVLMGVFSLFLGEKENFISSHTQGYKITNW